MGRAAAASAMASMASAALVWAAGRAAHAASPGSQWPADVVQARAATAEPSAIAGSRRWHASVSPDASSAWAARTAEPSSGEQVRPRPSSSITMWVSTGPAPAPP